MVRRIQRRLKAVRQTDSTYQPGQLGGVGKRTATAILSDFPRFCPAKMNSPILASASVSTISNTHAASGTRCSRAAFIRSAGTVQTLASTSISDHRAPRTSPPRAAVRIANSRARAAVPSISRRCQGRPANRDKPLRHGGRAKASPGEGGAFPNIQPNVRGSEHDRRYGAGNANRIDTASMPPRNRVAVSGLLRQIGCSARKTWLTTSREPSPASRWRPPRDNMKTQLAAPEASTRKWRLPPSACRPGSVTVAQNRAASLCFAAMSRRLP